MTDSRKPEDARATVKWEIVEHPSGTGYALYCGIIGQYLLDADTKLIHWFDSIASAKRHMISRKFRGI